MRKLKLENQWRQNTGFVVALVTCMVLVMTVSRLASDDSYVQQTKAASRPVPSPGAQRRKLQPPDSLAKSATSKSPTPNATSEPFVCEPITLRPNGSLPLVALNSFPGSGNTWVRFLIEEVSGIYSGSVYCDKSLRKGGFAGECLNPLCGCTVVIKVHGIYGNVRHLPWHRGIYLMRNPYDAMISELNRRHGGGHTGVAPEKYFQGKVWKEYVNTSITKWEKMYDRALETFDLGVLVVHYEELRSDLEHNLRRISRFLRLNETTPSRPSTATWTAIRERRMQCTLAHNKGGFKRKKHQFATDPYTPDLRALIDEKIKYVLRRLEEEGDPLPPYAEEFN